jgi:hypothetical protein
MLCTVSSERDDEMDAGVKVLELLQCPGAEERILGDGFRENCRLDHLQGSRQPVTGGGEQRECNAVEDKERKLTT